MLFASSASRSWRASAMRPRESTPGGNAQPEPMMSKRPLLATPFAPPYPPIMTVGAPGPAMVAVPGGALLVHGMTVSPIRAAGIPPISTVPLPLMTLPSLVGGTTGETPGGVGRCGGTFCKPLPSTAAGLPPISTVLIHPIRIVPAYGCGNGVGTGGPGGAGTATMWVHRPGALSPITEAGGISSAHSSVDLDQPALELGHAAAVERHLGRGSYVRGRAFDLESRRCLDLGVRTLHFERLLRLGFHRLALERKLIGRFEVDRLALDGDVALWCLEQHVAFEVDGQLVVLGVVLNFVLARVVDDADAWLVVRVVERHDMARPGADDALFDLATAALHELVVLLRRRVFAVPEPAQDIGIVDVAMLEGDDHLVIDFRHELETAFGATARRHQPCPVTLVVVRQPRELHLDAALSVRILVIGHDADDQPQARWWRPVVLGGQQVHQRRGLEAGDREARRIPALGVVRVRGGGHEVGA